MNLRLVAALVCLICLAGCKPKPLEVKTPWGQTQFLKGVDALVWLEHRGKLLKRSHHYRGAELVWRSNLDGQLTTERRRSISTEDLSVGVHTLTVEVTLDGVRRADLDGTTQVEILRGSTPVPTIFEPQASENFAVGSLVKLRGVGHDLDDGQLAPDRLTWTVPGVLTEGHGEELSVQLPAGTHTITLECVDRSGLVGISQVTVTVGSGLPPATTVAPVTAAPASTTAPASSSPTGPPTAGVVGGLSGQ